MVGLAASFGGLVILRSIAGAITNGSQVYEPVMPTIIQLLKRRGGSRILVDVSQFSNGRFGVLPGDICLASDLLRQLIGERLGQEEFNSRLLVNLQPSQSGLTVVIM